MKAFALCGLLAGSFAMPCAMSGASLASTRSSGSAPLTCCSCSAARSPENGGSPVRHSKNTPVAAYTSLAGLAESPSHRSGARYDGVPTACISSAASAAIPKPVSLT